MLGVKIIADGCACVRRVRSIIEARSEASFASETLGSRLKCLSTSSQTTSSGIAASGGRCNDGPESLVEITFTGFAEHDGGGALPAAVQRCEHAQPLADRLWSTGAGTTLPGRQQAARHDFEQFSGEAFDLRLLHRWNSVAVSGDQ